MLAFTSDESGEFEVYVAPVSSTEAECRVSVGGGDDPRWAASGELFYLAGSQVMVVTEAQVVASCDPRPEVVFEGVEKISWDVAVDGDFFVTLEPRPEPKLFLAINWFEELRERMGN